jgi:hypothetical protein
MSCPGVEDHPDLWSLLLLEHLPGLIIIHNMCGSVLAVLAAPFLYE